MPDARPDLPRPGRPGEERGRGRERGSARWATVLSTLFPASPARHAPPRTRAAWLTAAGLDAAAIAAGAGLLLLRQSGVPSWRTLWGEDGYVFLPQALAHPLASLLSPYAGYLQLVPRLIADGVTLLPLTDAAMAFAVTGALIAAGCAVFVGHASAGHIRSPWLRAVLAAGVVLLPSAVVEVANSGVDAPWYLVFAAFWALLWRPRSPAGRVFAAAICFAAASSQLLVILLAPLVLARVLVLRRWSEHAATAGWLAGIIMQLAFYAPSPELGRLGSLPAALRFYGQHVLLAAVAGRQLAGLLQEASAPGAVMLATGALAAGALWMLARGGPRLALVAVTCLTLGLALTVVPAVIRSWVTTPLPASAVWIPGSRYTVVPILLIYSAALVAADALLARAGGAPGRWLALTALLLVLVVPWAADFRGANLRSSYPPWPQTVSRLAARCQHSGRPTIWADPIRGTVRCSRLE
ncbi:MAG TPA: hypothetical protein VIX86_24030 [Streptosporangiaceae bacterium]